MTINLKCANDKANMERYKNHHGPVAGERLTRLSGLQKRLSGLQKQRDQSKCNLRKSKQLPGGATKSENEESLQRLERAVKYHQTQLWADLWKLPNWLDLRVVLPASNKESPSLLASIEDPIFCVGGYRSLSASNQQHEVALTDHGCNLASALSSYFLENFHTNIRRTKLKIQQHWSLPIRTESLTKEQYHNVWGCCGEVWCPACRSGEQTTIAAPPWLTALRNLSNQGNTYFDRQLPAVNIVSTSYKDPHDRRYKIASKKNKTPWHSRLSAEDTTQLVVITGSSVQHDVQPLLKTLLFECIVPIYEQLVPEACFVVEQLPYSELQPYESSRWIVREGSTRLAMLSNLRDYCCERKIRHHGTKEHCLVVQGTVCTIPVTMDWMARWHAQETGLRIPPVLRPYHLHCEEASIPFRRTLRIGKGGRKVVHEIKGMERITHDDGFMHPSPDRIRAEAATAPSSFLPFYYR